MENRMQKWEYEVESFTERLNMDEIEYLQDRGNGGWELCHVTNPSIVDSSHRLSRTYYWKRPLTESE